MSRGRKPGSGESASRVLEVLRALGTDGGGRSFSIRTAELCQRAKIEAGNLARIVQPLIDTGEVLVCKVTVPGMRGGPKNEYRLASMAAPPFRPLDTRRAGVALGKPGKPLPVTTPAPAVSTPRAPANEIEPRRLARTPAPAAEGKRLDVATVEELELRKRLQLMDEPQFVDYLRHLSRVWSWGRARQLVDAALAHP